MKNILWALLFALLTTTATAEEVEEVIVVGAYIVEGNADVEYDDTLLESIMPTKSYVAGGPGAFQGIMLNGTDTKHTAVYKNGVPVNDPSSGWFDFGTELITGQNTKLISGPNSVQFGSGSMSGVVLIEDDLKQREFISKIADDKTSLFTSIDGFQLAHYKGTNGSVRSDNTENDWYENTTAKFGGDVNGWSIRGEYTDYNYDYDNCWMPDFSVSNICNQDGE
jgi:outer membrane cobalamin receptor